MKGAPLLLVKSLLGHQSLDMVQRYGHLLPGLDCDAVDRLDLSGSIREQALELGPGLRPAPRKMSCLVKF